MHHILAVSLLCLAPVVAVVHARAQTPAVPPGAKPIEGTWIYAKDPTGAVPPEAIYEGSTIALLPEGKYAFQLGGTSIALQGTWELRGAEGDTFKVHTEYGQGRSNDLTLTIRRNAKGVVVGMEVREGDESTGARYYVPRLR